MNKIKIVLVFLIVMMVYSVSTYAWHEPADWAKYEVELAAQVGLLPDNARDTSFSDNITREEFCEIIMRMYEKATGKKVEPPKVNPFKDTNNPYILKAAGLGIISGPGDGTFRPKDLLTRQEAAKMLYNSMFADKSTTSLGSMWFEDSDSIADWAKLPIYVLYTNKIMTGNDRFEIMPLNNLTRQEAMVLSVRTLAKVNIKPFDDAGIYMTGKPRVQSWDMMLYKGSVSVMFYMDEQHDKDGTLMFEFYSEDGTLAHKTEVSKNIYGSYTLDIGAYKRNWVDDTSQWDYVEDNAFEKIYGEGTDPKKFILKVVPISSKKIASTNTLTKQVKLIPYMNLNDALFGDPDRQSFESDAQARTRMVTFNVNVWKVDKSGNKYASTANITINRMVADDVWNIFQRIFEAPDQFPIYSVGGYDWRGGGRTEHNLGTAVDINANENAFISRDGTILAGSFYRPNENQYSLPEDGIVVQTFLNYGWGWGGHGWSNGYDYMHFSLFGT